MIWGPEEIPVLQAGTITLRPIRPTDAEDVFRGVQDLEIPRFTTVPANYSMSLAIEFSNSRAKASHANQSELLFVIEDSRLSNLSEYPYSNGFSGVVSLHTFDLSNHRAELGYWITKEARGKRIGTQAVEIITEYGLLTMGFRRIAGLVDDLNGASKKLLLNAGYVYEGLLKQYVTRSDGSQRDMAVFAATRN